MIENGLLANTKKLRDEMQVSLMICKKYLVENNNNYTQAKEALTLAIQKGDIAGYAMTQKRFGITGADVRMEGDFGVIVSISCGSESASKSNTFTNLLDVLLLIGLDNKEVVNVSEFLGTDIPESVKTFYKEDHVRNSSLVEDLVMHVSNLLREEVRVEYYKRVIAPLGGGDRTKLFVYQHDNKMACIAEFCPYPSDKDVSAHAQKITATACCYAPLVSHEHTLPDSIKKYYMDHFVDKTKDKEKQWEKFLDTIVLDRIKIPKEPVQELNVLAASKQANNPKTHYVTIQEICNIHKMNVMDFHRYEFVYNPEI